MVNKLDFILFCNWSQLLKTLHLPNIKLICPTAPTRPVALFGVFLALLACLQGFDAGDISEEAPSDLEGLDASATHVANLLSIEPPNSRFVCASLPVQFAMAGVSQSMNISCELPILKGDNYKVLKERVLHLGWMDIDYAIRKDEPPAITETSEPDAVDLYEKWERSNRLSVMFIKTNISASIRGSVDQHDKVRDLLKAIDEQFTTSEKSLASTLIMKFSSIKLTGTRGVCEHIMRLRDIVAQLKTLEVTMSESFLVHFILCTLPQQYTPFKISYNTHKDKWSIKELMTMCVQEEERLIMEEGEKVPLFGPHFRFSPSPLKTLSFSRRPPNLSQKNEDLGLVHRWIIVKFEYHVRNPISNILTVGNFKIISEIREKPFAL
ncbi:hypothetical protein D0Y65_053009 [Glycine soja]|uniref:Uncharacterized protein n=1 Tax=Glycine soja TaxID=3848 RepID=A0A445F0A6_GLYSO|nr:hypothetical protein D0Y65_053009 [Glycine soja]